MSDTVQSRMKVSREGIVLIKSLEGFRARAAVRPDGGWTIGYGHTRSAREGAEVGESDAELLLQYDLLPVVAAINGHVSTPLNQHQFDALASFAFSVGTERFIASDVLERLNEGGDAEAAEAMIRWPVRESAAPPALRRRAAERALFTADPSRPVTLADLFAAPLPPPEAPVPPAPANDVDPAPVVGRGDARAQAVAVLLGEASQSLIADPAPVAPQPPATPPAAPTPAPRTPNGAGMMMSMMRYSAYGAPAFGPLPEVADPTASPSDPRLNLSMPTQISVSAPAPAAAPVEPVPVPPVVEAAPAVAVEPQAVPAPTASPSPAPSPAMVPPLILTSPPALDPAPDQRPVWDEHERVPAPDATGPLFDDPGYDPVLRHEASEAQPAPRAEWGETSAFAVMGGVGLVSFGAAMAAFRLAVEQDALVGETGLIGGVLALIGATCLGVSGYNLYRRWEHSGRE